MDSSYSQQGRLLTLSTSLGPDVLLLTAFSGREELSRPYAYQLELLSEEAAIPPPLILGKEVTWAVEHFDREPRFFNGIIHRFVAQDRRIQDFRVYRAEVVPRFWFLSRATNCRIFQNRTAPEIIKTVLDDYGFTDYEFELDGSYPTREYCVQYRESALDFLSRLMEEEGIYYYFRHEAGRHVLVIGDSLRAFRDCREDEVIYGPGSQTFNRISSWEHQYDFLTGKWSQSDYNFKTPSTNLLTGTDTLLDTPGLASFERFEYPGGYERLSDGRKITKVRMEEEEAAYDVATGAGRCCTFTPGGKFRLFGHDFDEENRGYVLTSVEHSAVDTSYTSAATGSTYSNTFTCIPDNVAFRPRRRTPKASVAGPQTAVVVGPKGEEIYTDEFGRVKIQFFWDRVGRHDENSSCWARVSENWAGKNFGVVFNPRIGQEVVVEFLDGDPDRPLITGRVYNALQMPPYPLPDHQTKSVIRSRSTGSDDPKHCNELTFEDKGGSEDVYFHAQKDFHRVVEDHDDLKVNNDQTIKIATTTSTTAGQSIELSVGQNSIKIDQSGITITALKVSITGQMSVSVDSPGTVSVTGVTSLSLDSAGSWSATAAASLSLSSAAITVQSAATTISGGALTVAAATMNVVAMTTILGVKAPYIPVPSPV